jgi:hypothetical protein
MKNQGWSGVMYDTKSAEFKQVYTPLTLPCDEVDTILNEARRSAVKLGQQNHPFWTFAENTSKAGRNEWHVGCVPEWLTTSQRWRNQNLERYMKLIIIPNETD